VGTAEVTATMAHKDEGKLCWECHRDVPHGDVRGLNSAPDARVPLAEEPVPDWLQKMVNESKNSEDVLKAK